ncbi:hypothetical protein [Bacillus sp. UNC41MFS5]|uniref:hypothetical protein n=1 Tax=Bacillus sp. UNC41MFS5 TaxID=1449046 RepID=UPI001E3D7880|nr:hypothetical protein [Bacillus sp. UNC41MFS5]
MLTKRVTWENVQIVKESLLLLMILNNGIRGGLGIIFRTLYAIEKKVLVQLTGAYVKDGMAVAIPFSYVLNGRLV